MTKAWSNQPPLRYEVVHKAGDDMCTVVFYTAVRSILTPGGNTAYCADVIRLRVAFNPGILEDIQNNYTEWLTMAVADNVKCRRDTT